MTHFDVAKLQRLVTFCCDCCFRLNLTFTAGTHGRVEKSALLTSRASLKISKRFIISREDEKLDGKSC